MSGNLRMLQWPSLDAATTFKLGSATGPVTPPLHLQAASGAEHPLGGGCRGLHGPTRGSARRPDLLPPWSPRRAGRIRCPPPECTAQLDLHAGPGGRHRRPQNATVGGTQAWFCLPGGPLAGHGDVANYRWPASPTLVWWRHHHPPSSAAPVAEGVLPEQKYPVRGQFFVHERDTKYICVLDVTL